MMRRNCHRDFKGIIGDNYNKFHNARLDVLNVFDVYNLYTTLLHNYYLVYNTFNILYDFGIYSKIKLSIFFLPVGHFVKIYSF